MPPPLDKPPGKLGPSVSPSSERAASAADKESECSQSAVKDEGAKEEEGVVEPKPGEARPVGSDDDQEDEEERAAFAEIAAVTATDLAAVTAKAKKKEKEKGKAEEKKWPKAEAKKRPVKMEPQEKKLAAPPGAKHPEKKMPAPGPKRVAPPPPGTSTKSPPPLPPGPPPLDYSGERREEAIVNVYWGHDRRSGSVVIQFASHEMPAYIYQRIQDHKVGLVPHRRCLAV